MNFDYFRLYFLATAIIFFLDANGSAQTFNPTPAVFGKGSVSSKDFEFNASFTPDGKTVFFTKALHPNWRRLSIVYSTFDGGGWSKPKLASFSGQYRDADPVVAADGNKIFFISDRPSPVEKKPTDYHFWYVEKTSKGWSEAKHLDGDFYQTTPNPVYPSISQSGNIYYSYSDGKDSEIYVIKPQNGRYGLPEKLSFNSSSFIDLDPVVAPDESFIIFNSSAARKGMGAGDLWVSFNENGKWTEPINLGNTINSAAGDGQPGLSQDGKKLYFTSIRSDNNDDNLPRSKVISQSEFDAELESIFNGYPNIWEVDISRIKELLRNESK